jgi:hypothetical protein
MPAFDNRRRRRIFRKVKDDAKRVAINAYDSEFRTGAGYLVDLRRFVVRHGSLGL